MVLKLAALTIVITVAHHKKTKVISTFTKIVMPMLKLKFSRKGCKAFFKKHPQAKKLAQTKITTAITKEVQTGMTKVKVATQQKINGLPCYEMRLNLGKMGSVRIAFTVYDNQAQIHYLTTTLQKDEFSKELEKILN